MTDYNIGLVLSGGGTKGMAHIGALQAIDDMGVKIDVISATSSGAVAGALYASGVKPAEMLDFYLKIPKWKLFSFPWKKPGFVNTAKIATIILDILPVETFEELNIPLYVVASDLLSAREKVFHSGNLRNALMSSFAFPVIFSPVEFDGELYADGGILNNFPTEPIRSQCNELIGVHVQNISRIERNQLKSTISVFQRIYSLVARYDSMSKYIECDVVVSPKKLQEYNTFEMRKFKEMYDIGYEETMKELNAYFSKKQSTHS